MHQAALTYRYFSLSLFLCFCLIFTGIARAQQDDVMNIRFKISGTILTKEGRDPEGVVLELKKNGKTIKSVTVAKNGKYDILSEISINPADADFELHISKEGMLSKTFEMNTYLGVPMALSYYFRLDVNMEVKKNQDIVLNSTGGKILWNQKEKKFILEKTADIVKKKEKPPEEIVKEMAVPVTIKKMEETVNSKPKVQSATLAKADNISAERKKITKNFPEEISLDLIQQENCKVIKKTVVKNDKTTVYYKKIWNWGGVYYFVEDFSSFQSISENTYEMDTKGLN